MSDGGKKRVEVEEGDFVLIPAWMEHQEVNDGDQDVVWAIVRSGRKPRVTDFSAKNVLTSRFDHTCTAVLRDCNDW